MPRRLILVRHGETEINRTNKGPEKDHVIGGRSLNEPLLPKGEEGATEAGKKIAAMEFLSIAEILSSDAVRAGKTAELIDAELPAVEGRTLRLTENLRERFAGVFDGMKKEDAKQSHPEYFSDPDLIRWQHDFEQHAPGGENYSDVLKRVREELEPRLHEETGDILVVSHVIPIRCILHWMLGLTREQTIALKIPNTTPIIIELGEENKLVGDVTLESLMPKS